MGLMPNRPRRPRDPNELAFQVFQEAIGEATPPPPEREKNAAAVALGKLGGAKGGAARAAKMTAGERAESARHAAIVRWKKQNPKPDGEFAVAAPRRSNNWSRHGQPGCKDLPPWGPSSPQPTRRG